MTKQTKDESVKLIKGAVIGVVNGSRISQNRSPTGLHQTQLDANLNWFWSCLKSQVTRNVGHCDKSLLKREIQVRRAMFLWRYWVMIKPEELYVCWTKMQYCLARAVKPLLILARREGVVMSHYLCWHASCTCFLCTMCPAVIMNTKRPAAHLRVTPYVLENNV